MPGKVAELASGRVPGRGKRSRLAAASAARAQSHASPALIWVSVGTRTCGRRPRARPPSPRTAAAGSCVCGTSRHMRPHALTLRARTGAITRGGRLRACAARQQQQSTRRAVLSQHARCPRTGARVSEAAGWIDRMAARLHSRHREPCHARAAFHRAGLHQPRLSKVVNLQGTASPARVKWKAVAVGLARPGHEPDV